MQRCSALADHWSLAAGGIWQGLASWNTRLPSQSAPRFAMPAEQIVSICGPMSADAISRPSRNDPHWLQVPEAEAFAPVSQALANHSGHRTLARLNEALAGSKSAREFRRWMAGAQREAGRDELPLLLAFQRYFDRLASSN